MKNPLMNKFSIFLAIILVTLCACSKVTQENFSKIRTGMTTEEVVALLGEPTESKSIDIAGLSGTALTWRHRQSEINIEFFNDKVTIKTFNKITELPSKS